MDKNTITTEDVAKRLNTGVQTVLVYLHRHPELRPKRSFANGFVWTEEEVEAIAAHRMRPISRGKRKQK